MARDEPLPTTALPAAIVPADETADNADALATAIVDAMAATPAGAHLARRARAHAPLDARTAVPRDARRVESRFGIDPIYAKPVHS